MLGWGIFGGSGVSKMHTWPMLLDLVCRISDIRIGTNKLGDRRWMTKNVQIVRSGHLETVWWTAMEVPVLSPLLSSQATPN